GGRILSFVPGGRAADVLEFEVDDEQVAAAVCRHRGGSQEGPRMVRILKVKELEDRKKLLLLQSEMYRHTLRLETANVKYSLALMKRKYKSPLGLLKLGGGMAPLAAGFFLVRRFLRKRAATPDQEPRGGGGLIPKIMTGLQLLSHLRPLVQS